MSFLQKFLRERNERNAVLKKAQEDLDALNKSATEGEGELSAIGQLEKALVDFSNLEPLVKSQEDSEEEKKEREKEKEEEELEKARLETEREDRLEKARQEGNEDLVEASIAFEDLAKSVDDVSQMAGEGLDLLAKGLGSNTDLLVKTAAGLVDLHKSLNLLVEMVGKMPIGGGSAIQIGFQKGRIEESTETGDRTSVEAAREILVKAISDDNITLPVGLLSHLDTTKNVGVIPLDLREKYKIKA